MERDQVWENLKQTENFKEFETILGQTFLSLRRIKEPNTKDTLNKLAGLKIFLTDLEDQCQQEPVFARLKICLDIIAESSPELLISSGYPLVERYLLKGDETIFTSPITA